MSLSSNTLMKAGTGLPAALDVGVDPGVCMRLGPMGVGMEDAGGVGSCEGICVRPSNAEGERTEGLSCDGLGATHDANWKRISVTAAIDNARELTEDSQVQAPG